MDKELALKAERMAKRAGMPLAPPPPIPPTEHIPAVDQPNQQPDTARIVKPMGAMAGGDPEGAEERRGLVRVGDEPATGTGGDTRGAPAPQPVRRRERRWNGACLFYQSLA